MEKQNEISSSKKHYEKRKRELLVCLSAYATHKKEEVSIEQWLEINKRVKPSRDYKQLISRA